MAFGHHPMLNPNILLRVHVRPTRDIARRIDSWNAAFEKFIDRDAAVKLKAGLFG